MSNQSPNPSSPAQSIQQDLTGDRNQTIGQVYGGMVVYVSGGQAIINPDTPQQSQTQAAKPIGANPYKGLLAFDEKDGDRYFGRSTEIQLLWQRFKHLNEAEDAIRFLPIYGPSGSGKSSLARAGLLRELGRSPLSGRDRSRGLVLVPGDDPLYSLAVVLAKIATGDPNPAEKADEFKRVLKKDEDGEFTGLKRIAYGFQDIATAPLIVLVDQFEEIYSYEPQSNSLEDAKKREKFVAERDAFIGNLLCAAGDRSQYVSVIVTCRSDFLGETQQHPKLNQLFSTQGFLVPIMQPEEMEGAISEPAKQAGRELDPATVRLLVEQARGQQGALPLLQFALQRIWEGLEQGVESLGTLEEIGGVGGALAHEAQQLYNSLNKDEQKIAQRIFVSLVQIEDGSEGTRRRVAKSELITSDSDAPQVEAIIKRFAAPGVRFLVTSFDAERGDTIEVAHEALIRNWEQLQEWLAECREALRQKRKIEQEAQEWEKRERNKDFLLQGRPLRDAKEFIQAFNSRQATSLSSLATEFIRCSIQKKIWGTVKSLSIFLVFPLLGTLIPIHFFLLNQATTALTSEKCEKNPEVVFLLRYMILAGEKDDLEGANFCAEDLEGINLDQAILWEANFDSAILTNSDFQGAFLKDASFRNANLTGASLTKSRLDGANFSGSFLHKANLEEVIGLTETQLEEAYLCNTKLPQNLNVDPNRDCK
ncbi:MAG: pentapeptide repeat-containing protein [Elainellaceae cyanobacterium]